MRPRVRQTVLIQIFGKQPTDAPLGGSRDEARRDEMETRFDTASLADSTNWAEVMTNSAPFSREEKMPRRSS